MCGACCFRKRWMKMTWHVESTEDFFLWIFFLFIFDSLYSWCLFKLRVHKPSDVSVCVNASSGECVFCRIVKSVCHCYGRFAIPLCVFLLRHIYAFLIIIIDILSSVRFIIFLYDSILHDGGQDRKWFFFSFFACLSCLRCVCVKYKRINGTPLNRFTRRKKIHSPSLFLSFLSHCDAV